MAFDVTPERIMQYLKHDGLQKIWDTTEPRCYRGFHHQEMIDVGFALGKYVVMIEALPCLGFNGQHYSIMDNETLQSRMQVYLKMHDGVLVSDTHAVAWCAEEQKCYDPNGVIYGVDNFAIREFFAIVGDTNGETKRLQGTIQPG
jgi:hypothetical protein